MPTFPRMTYSETKEQVGTAQNFPACDVCEEEWQGKVPTQSSGVINSKGLCFSWGSLYDNCSINQPRVGEAMILFFSNVQ